MALLVNCVVHHRDSNFRNFMKKATWILLGIIAAIGVAIYYILNKTPAVTTAANTPANTTATQTGVSQWWTGWSNFTNTSLGNQGGFMAGANSLLTGISNAFGGNDGGANPGVSVGGSAAGGIASSGSGAGIPSPLSQVTDLWSTVFNNANYAPAPLNNYDVQNAAANNLSTSSNNATDTTVSGPTSDSDFDYSEYLS